MVQRVEALAFKPDSFNLVPGNHTVKRETELIATSCLLTLECMLYHAHLHTHSGDT